MFSKKFYFMVVVILLIGMVFYLITSPYRIDRIKSWLGLIPNQTSEVILNKQDKKADTKSDKIINILDGIVIAVEKDKVYVRNEAYNVTIIYDNFRKINPLVIVGKAVPKGYTLGRKNGK